MHDEINSPSHYQLLPDMQAIELIKIVLTPDEFVGYLKGNALKYRLRAGEKGPAEKCIAKARWYQSALCDLSIRQVVEWPTPEQEARQDVINQNGNDGLPYRCHECAAEHCNCVSR